MTTYRLDLYNYDYRDYDNPCLRVEETVIADSFTDLITKLKSYDLSQYDHSVISAIDNEITDDGTKIDSSSYREMKVW